MGRVIGATTILVLLVGTSFAGNWYLVWLSLGNSGSSSSSVAQQNFTPVKPSVPLSPVNIDKECSDFFDQDDVQKYYVAQGGPESDPDRLDLDKDGLACENYDYNQSDTPVPPSTAGVQNPKFRSPDTSEVNAK